MKKTATYFLILFAATLFLGGCKAHGQTQAPPTQTQSNMFTTEITEIITGFNTDGQGVTVLGNISPSAMKVSLQNEQFTEIVGLLALSYKEKKKLKLTLKVGTQEILNASLAD